MTTRPTRPSQRLVTSDGGPLVEVTPQEDGSHLALVDATNKSAQVFFDIDEDRELKTDEALDTNAWDLSFQRYTVTMNGGGGTCFWTPST
jgi:hypothetical protein